MKPTAFLINTARGAVIDEDDLIAVLKSKTIAGAALDVQHPEPPTVSSPLFELNNVIVTPHIGWKRVETRQRLVNAVAENVRAFLAGAPVNVVNS
jgi:glycerate dehydrogenase